MVLGPKPGQIQHVAYNDLSALKAVISDRCAVVMEPPQGGGRCPARRSGVLPRQNCVMPKERPVDLDEVCRPAWAALVACLPTCS